LPVAAARIARVRHERIAIYRLLNAVPGFGSDPLSNVRWALQQLAKTHPRVLVGHSLGGSMTLAAASEANVEVVVALAPWLSGSEQTRQLGERPTLIAHGSNDRVTSCRASQQ
jgi:predicted esterase